jgi:hypothetical protein
MQKHKQKKVKFYTTQQMALKKHALAIHCDIAKI